MASLRHAGIPLATVAWLAAPAAAWEEPKPTIEPVPGWVRELPVPAPNPANQDQPFQLLLSSVQQHIGAATNEIHVRTVAVPQTTAGLQALGNVTIPWNSERADLKIHHLLLRRGTETIDLLKTQDVVVLRRENNLESSVLDGVRTVVLQIPGLQVGDQIDLALTQQLRSVLPGTKPESLITVVDVPPTAMLDRRLLVDDGTKVSWRADPSFGLRPTKRGRQTEYAYDKSDFSPLKIPDNAPLRYRYPAIQVTNYASWREVAAVLKPLYDKARRPEPGSPLLAIADEIMKSNSTSETRMLAALRVAQEKVRYVALALGEGAYVPATADQTWTRKFGDCKGKSAMLLALLDRLGISAEAMLTSTDASPLLGERLPSLEAFNHVLVKARIGEREFVLDPTNYGQRTLTELQLPSIDWGLPMIDAAELWRAPKAPPPYPLFETDINWDASKGFDQQVPFTATLIYRDSMASLMRAIQASASDRDAFEKYLKSQVPRIDDEALQIESIEPEGTNGQFQARFKGTASMTWNRKLGGRQYYFDHSVPSWKPAFERDAGPSKDLPVALTWPSWTHSQETVLLPLNGNGFSLKAQPIDSSVAGTQIRRSGRIEAGRAIVIADFRRTAPEITAAEARAATAVLDRITHDYAIATAPKDYVVSKDEIKAIISKDAEGYDEYVNRARLLMDQRDRTRAIAELDKAIKIDPGGAEAPALKSIIYYSLGRPKEGRADLNKAISLDPEDADVLRAQALFAWHDRDTQLALKAVNQAIDKMPNYYGLYSIRAEIRAGLGQYDDALVDVRRAVELSADTMSPAAIAKYEAASGRLDQALTTLDQAIATRAKEEPYLYVLKGDFLTLQGKKAEAEASYRLGRDGTRAQYNERLQAATSKRPTPPDYELELLVATRNFAEAEQVADRKIGAQRFPAAANLAKRAWVRMMNGKYDGAISDAKEALGLDPSDPTAQASLILAYLRLQKFREAETLATKGLAENEASAIYYYARAIARTGLGNSAGAAEDLKAARQLQFDVALDPSFFGLKASP